MQFTFCHINGKMCVPTNSICMACTSSAQITCINRSTVNFNIGKSSITRHTGTPRNWIQFGDITTSTTYIAINIFAIVIIIFPYINRTAINSNLSISATIKTCTTCSNTYS